MMPSIKVKNSYALQWRGLPPFLCCVWRMQKLGQQTGVTPIGENLWMYHKFPRWEYPFKLRVICMEVD